MMNLNAKTLFAMVFWVSLYFVFVGQYIASTDATKATQYALPDSAKIEVKVPAEARVNQGTSPWGQISGFFSGIGDTINKGLSYIADGLAYIGSIFVFIGRVLTFDVPVPPELESIMVIVRPILTLSVSIPCGFILFAIVKEIVGMVKPFGGT